MKMESHMLEMLIAQQHQQIDNIFVLVQPHVMVYRSFFTLIHSPFNDSLNKS